MSSISSSLTGVSHWLGEHWRGVNSALAELMDLNQEERFTPPWSGVEAIRFTARRLTSGTVNAVGIETAAAREAGLPYQWLSTPLGHQLVILDPTLWRDLTSEPSASMPHPDVAWMERHFLNKKVIGERFKEIASEIEGGLREIGPDGAHRVKHLVFEGVIARAISGFFFPRESREAVRNGLLGLGNQELPAIIRAHSHDGTMHQQMCEDQLPEEEACLFSTLYLQTAQRKCSKLLLSALTLLAEKEREQTNLAKRLHTLKLTLEALHKEPYLHSVMEETLRLSPVKPLLQHTLLEPAWIEDDVEVEAGTSLLYDLYHAGRDPRAWKEPEEVDFERFLWTKPERVSPFGGPTAPCPAEDLSLTLVKLALAYLVTIYEITPADVGVSLSPRSSSSPEEAN